MDDGENEVDGRCIAVPILPGRLPVALSLERAAASRLPLQRVQEVATSLKEVADSVAEMSLIGPRLRSASAPASRAGAPRRRGPGRRTSARS